MPIKVPTYQRQVAPDVARVQNAPDIPRLDLSSPLSGIAKVGAANQALGETVSKIGVQLANHAIEQQKVKNEAYNAELDTAYRRELQNILYNPEPETVKVNGQDVVRTKGVMMRPLDEAYGATQDFDVQASTLANRYLSQVKDPRYRAQLAQQLGSYSFSKQNDVISHEAKQIRESQVNKFKSNITQQIDDGYSINNPIALNSSMEEVALRQKELNNYMGVDDDTGNLAIQKNVSALAENSVMGKLKTTGNALEAQALLDSVKDNIPEKSYLDIQTKIQTGEKTIQKNLEHAALVSKVNNRFDMVNQISTGKLRWDNSGETIKNVALVDKDLAEAMQNVVSSEGKTYQPKNEVNDEYQKMVLGIFTSSSNEEVSKFLIDSMNGTGNGQISRDRLAILVDAAQMRAKMLPPVKADGTPLDPAGIVLEGSTKAILRWNEAHGNNDPHTLDTFLNELHAGKQPYEAYNIAVKNTIVKQHPEVAAQEDVPNAIVSKDDPVKYVFTGETNIYPARIWNSQKGIFEVNTNRAKGTKDKPAEAKK